MASQSLGCTAEEHRLPMQRFSNLRTNVDAPTWWKADPKERESLRETELTCLVSSSKPTAASVSSSLAGVWSRGVSLEFNPNFSSQPVA